MAETEQVLKQLDHITEELAHVKTFVLTHVVLEHKKQAKAAWQKLLKASQRVQWDRIDAIDEIRQQRGRGNP